MVTMGKLPQTPRGKKLVEYAIEEARNLNHNYVGTEHLLLGLIREEEGVAAQVLMNLGLKLSDVRAELLNLLGQDIRPGVSVDPSALTRPKRTPALDTFALDLTSEANRGKLPPIIGRREELDRILLVFSCLSRNSAILVGDAGVGKRAIIRGLAGISAGNEWPANLKRRRILGLDLSHLVTTTKNDEQTKERIRAVMKELRTSDDKLLFLDDMERFIRPPGTLVAEYVWSAFRSGLGRGYLQCVAVATPQQYQCLAVDGTLGRSFQPVYVDPLSKDQTLEILRIKRGVYESHYRVEIVEDAFEATVELCEQCIKDRSMPGNAVQLLDLACALVRLNRSAAPPDLKELEAEIDRLNQEKEQAVAEQDFEKGAYLRDQVDKLKKGRGAIEAKWNQEVFVKIGKVDKETVEQTVSKLAGTLPESFN